MIQMAVTVYTELRSRGRSLPGVLALVVSPACSLEEPPFRCSEDSHCVQGTGRGLCEPTGYCSTSDDECDSGRRYAPLAAPELAGGCVREGCAEGLSAGELHACLRTEVDVYCWGELGGDEPQKEPERIAGEEGFVVSLASGARHGCAVWAPSYGVRCWGDNASGQLGVDPADIGSVAFGPVSAAAVETLGLDFTRVAAGGESTCAWSESSARCWGANDSHQLGSSSTPNPGQAVSLDEHDFVEIALGARHGCGITRTSEVKCWGDNRDGQAGAPLDADAPYVSAPRPVSLDDGTRLEARELALGDGHSCARTSSGSVYCWGRNTSGQLGSSRETTHVPGEVAFIAPAFPRSLSAGSEHTCAALEDGRVTCWGSSAHERLGPDVASLDGVDVSTFYLGVPAIEVRAGRDASCARTETDLDAYCWGSNVHGQIGNGRFHESEGPDPTLNRHVACSP